MKTKQLRNELSRKYNQSELFSSLCFNLSDASQPGRGARVACEMSPALFGAIEDKKVKEGTCRAPSQPGAVALAWKHVKYRRIPLCPRGAISIILSSWLSLTWEESRHIRDTARGSC